jgi:hypothetical protein
MTTMTIDQFRATGVDCDDLGPATGDESVAGSPGRTYLGTLHIERWDDDRHGIAPPNGPTWLLILGSVQRNGALADLEADLYEWARDEGHLEDGPAAS